MMTHGSQCFTLSPSSCNSAIHCDVNISAIGITSEGAAVTEASLSRALHVKPRLCSLHGVQSTAL